MASTARSRIQPARDRKPAKPIAKSSLRRKESDLLAAVMVSVSASLEKMNPEERERAVIGAEKAVAHLR